MYNQNWHVVYGPATTNADISPDTQVTEAVEVAFRMDDQPFGSPGPEITVSVFGEYTDPNGQRDDGSWPPVVIGTQVAYAIRDADDEVNDADYEYTLGDWACDPGPDNDYPDLMNGDLMNGVKRVAASYAARGDTGWDWNGKSAMQREGGPV